MPLNIRPPPDLAKLQYPREFDPKMEFRLRERCPSTMKQMQDIVVDVEENLKRREEQRREEQEERLHSVLQKIEEITQQITIKVKCLEHQNRSILQKESSDIHEQTCHKIEEVFIQPYVKEQSPDMLCEYNSFHSFSCLPKYDEYFDDDNHNDQISLAEVSDPILAESDVQVQRPKLSEQLAHFSYEEEEENAENFNSSKGTLPFCFESFQFIRDNYHAVYDQVSPYVAIDHLEDDQGIVSDVLPLFLQPQSAIEYQIEEENSEAAACDQMIQIAPLLLCFESSELCKEEKEKQVPISQVPSGPVCNELQVSFQVWNDPSAGRMNDDRGQLSSPLAGCKVQYQDVGDFQIQRHGSNPEPLYISLLQPGNCIYMLQDSFVQCLNTAKEVSSFLIFSKINKVISDCKISFFLISKHKQQRPIMFLLLKWLHWLFDFT